ARVAYITLISSAPPSLSNYPSTNCTTCEVYLLFSDLGETIDTRIKELVKLVITWTRKFGYDGPFVTRLEPVPCVRRDRVLVSRMQFDLMKDRVVRFAAF